MKPDERVRALRRQVAAEIVRALGPKSQYSIAPAYGIPQPRMSNLECGRVDRFSLEWLISRVHRMGGSVVLTVELGDVRRDWTLAHAKFGMSGRSRDVWPRRDRPNTTRIDLEPGRIDGSATDVSAVDDAHVGLLD